MVLTTKLFPPPLSGDTVARGRLFDVLDNALQPPVRLTLLSAPPGYGKSTLLASWLHTRTLPAVWLSLDESDNDPGEFCRLLVAGFAPYLPALSDLTLLLQWPQTANHANIVAELINRSTASEQDLVIVLDDYHVITSGEVHALVRLLLTHLPPRWHLAVLTREDPAFNLPQLRARRQMVELRARDLAFSETEGRAWFGESLRDDLTSQLVARTEGWAAGLQLASIALAQQTDAATFVEDFNGSHRFVLDYLVGEVIGWLPADLLHFLQRVAVLGRFSTDLCEAVLGPDPRGLIERATAANLFVIPLDTGGRWYRLHHLMAEVLRADVAVGERREIALRASRWYWGRHSYDEAIDLALAADEPQLAGEQIQQAALAIAEEGRLATVLGWIARVPEATLWSLPDLCVFRAWLWVYHGRFREAVDWIAGISARVDADLLRLDDAQAGLLAGIQAWLASLAGQPLDLAILRSALARVGARYAYFAPSMHLAVGQAERESGHFDAALAHFEEGARLSQGTVTGLILDNNRAFLLDALGRRRDARHLVESNIAGLGASEGAPGPLAAIPTIALGVFLAESGELEKAAETLTRSINSLHRLGLYDVLAIPAIHQLEAVLTDLGRFDEALRLNETARLRAQRVGLIGAAETLTASRAWVHWQSGRREPAAAWASAHPLSKDALDGLDRSLSVVLHCRALSANGDAATALRILNARLERARRAGLWMLWLREGVETALLYLVIRQRREAEALTRELIRVAADLEFRQVFRRHLSELGPLLTAVRDVAPAFVDALHGSVAVPQGQAQTVDALTDRELEILQLVAVGLSNAEIAARLFLAESTIKWYLSEIYGKLNARRRTEAVTRARELCLI